MGRGCNESRRIFPEHWKVVRLGDYIFKPEYGYTASAVKDSIGTKFLRITDIQDDSVDWKDVPYCKCDDDTKKKISLSSGRYSDCSYWGDYGKGVSCK